MVENANDLPKGIEDYLENSSGNIDISFKDQEELLYLIRARTGLKISVIEIILKEYFKEIRNEILKNRCSIIFGIGKILLGKKKIIFHPVKKFKNEIK